MKEGSNQIDLIYFSSPNLTGLYFKSVKLNICSSENSIRHSLNSLLFIKSFFREKDQGFSRETVIFSNNFSSIAFFSSFFFL